MTHSTPQLPEDSFAPFGEIRVNIPRRGRGCLSVVLLLVAVGLAAGGMWA